jgi:UDP-3-O-[3-hydroxymyristoyl] glucosamine N-acyltransferase
LKRSGRPATTASVTVAELAAALDGEVLAGAETRVSGAGGLEDAGAGDLVRVDGPKFLAQALASPAAALLVGPGVDPAGRPAIRARDPRVAFARALALFYPERRPAAGVEPTARLGPQVTVGAGCSVGAYVVLGAGVILGPNVILHPFVSLADGVSVGEGSVLFPRVTVYERVTLGRRVRVHSGAVIGADGFGYTAAAGAACKIPQVGTVVIEDDVEIGANSTIDRATTGETRVGAGTKIDNLVQIAHNVRIGRGCLIAAQVGIAGSSVLEDGVIMAGQAGVVDHVHVGAGVTVSAQSAVWSELPPGLLVSGSPARPHREQLRVQAGAARLPEMNERLRELERRLQNLEAREESAVGSPPDRRRNG